MFSIDRRWRWAVVCLLAVLVIWAALVASHLFLPNLWLPASPGGIPLRGQVERVNPHLYDQEWFDAARAGRQDITEALADAGYPVNAVNSSGYTALVLATYHGHLPEVRALLARHADPCIPDNNGNTALMGALFKGEQEVAEQLLDRCPIDQSNHSGQTALSFAALFGRLDFLPTLVQRGADPDHVDVEGKTALRIVSEQGNEQAAAALRSLGASGG
ncbi:MULTISPECIES: ankyrin repeat domain-containing protein [unclassified Pseudomonas]|uniref:ankyrin repeat domain-containing protein n=1 Tax=unclassified Pseudomonas TaxID=196821 RepID=UPI000D368F58|nr:MULTISPECIES: ankyrin repeat domain-containing protein [unclassified Pseudomonas]RAU42263.1 ankyrin repeat domain-containing protein [Pseudomonas sp. RIT 409]RAU55088.1 ankyrin repeat domain-containing protein [Pseudomonas sp. RIT 412]